MTAIEIELDPRGEGDGAPWHLRGSRKPVHDEVEITDLEVKGAIPPELSGRYIRNTANPRTGFTEHWFIGDGMLHGMELCDGRANWYRNRWVRTPMWENPGADRLTLALDPETFTFDHSVSAANTHIISHGGRLLALEEGSFPYEVTPQLDTVGPHTFDGKLAGPFTAHPKFCPETGEMLGFGYAQVEPYLTYYRVSPDGTLAQATDITGVGGPTMMHDFAASRGHAIFMDLPVVFDMELAMAGGMPMRWDAEYQARFGIMPREGTDADVQWFNVDPGYCFHTLNAIDDGDETVVWGCRVPELWVDSSDISMDAGVGDPAMSPRLYEWRFNRATGAVREGYLDDQSSEFPRVPDAMQGLAFRYGYTLGFVPENPDEQGGQLFKYDLTDGSKTVHEFPTGHEPGEAVFIPAEGAVNEDDGYLMTYVYQPQTDSSYMAILDASNMAADPVAEVHVPRRIVSGFHTSWIAD